MRDTETSVIELIRSRQELGIRKYGTTVARNPLELRQWLWHSLEEKLDDVIYMMRAIQEIDTRLSSSGSTPQQGSLLDHPPQTSDIWADPEGWW